MSYFKNQKEEQKDVVNVYIPTTIETVKELHLKCVELLSLANVKQGEIDETIKFIETTKFDGLVQKAIQEKETLIDEKRMILISYGRTFNELVKQQNLVINDSL